MTTPPPPPAAGFRRFWVASTASSAGTAVTTVALPILIVSVLHASTFELGLARAAQFVPYALIGLLAGAYVDRWRRKPVLVVSSLARAAFLAAIPALWALGWLQLWTLIILLLGFGTASVFGFAANQSFLPLVTPKAQLVSANARLDQSDATAQTLGPAVGGAVVGLLGAPLSLLIDAVSYVVDAILIGGIRVDEPRPPRGDRHLGREIAAGLRFGYGHPQLGPLAISGHVWFLGNSAALTVFAALALRTMGLSPLEYGIVLAVSGITTLVSAGLARRLGARLGIGGLIGAARFLYPLVWVVVAVLPENREAHDLDLPLLLVALAVYGFAMGVENSNEMAFRQAVAPPELLGRVNATIRSANRALAAVGAILGGLCASLFGIRVALVGVVAVLIIAALIVVLTPLRAARHPA